MNDANIGQTFREMFHSSLGDNDLVLNCIFHVLLNLLSKGKSQGILIMSHFPIHAPSAAGCEWDEMAKEGNSCLEMCLSGEAVQVAYGNKDYTTGLCVFGRVLASLGQRRSMTHHLSSQKQNNGETE